MQHIKNNMRNIRPQFKIKITNCQLSPIQHAFPTKGQQQQNQTELIIRGVENPIVGGAQRQ